MADETKIHVDDFAAFQTRDLANEGVRLPLRLPTGELTDAWLHIVGQESDVWRAAWTEAKRQVLKAARHTLGLSKTASDEEKAEAQRKRAAEEDEAELHLIAAHVTAWSRDLPCTPENVVAWLRGAPGIVDNLREKGADTTLFFGSCSSKLPGISRPKPDSTESSPEPKPHSENT